MSPDYHNAWSTVISVVLFLLWQMYKRDVDVLKAQNATQETDIATLKANHLSHSGNTDRMTDSIARLEDKVDNLTQLILGRKSDPPKRIR